MTTGNEGRVEVRRTFSHPAKRLFDAWTDEEGMRAWMRPGPTEDVRVQLDVRVGGAYTIEMIFGDESIVHTGRYTVVDRPRRLAFTWDAEHFDEPTTVTLDFVPTTEGTEVVLVHEGLPSEESAERHVGGWQTILEELASELDAEPSRS